MKICLVRNDKMGDMILTPPVVQGLKEVNKDYQIDIVCSKKNHNICKNYKSINRIFLLVVSRSLRNVFTSPLATEQGKKKMVWHQKTFSNKQNHPIQRNPPPVFLFF